MKKNNLNNEFLVEFSKKEELLIELKPILKIADLLLLSYQMYPLLLKTVTARNEKHLKNKSKRNIKCSLEHIGNKVSRTDNIIEVKMQKNKENPVKNQ